MTDTIETRLLNPTLSALRELGGTATRFAIFDYFQTHKKFSTEELSKPSPNKSHKFGLDYDLAWALTRLKKSGYVDNRSTRPALEYGQWGLTQKSLDMGCTLSEEEGRETAKQSHNPAEKDSEEGEVERELEYAIDFAHITERDVEAEFHHHIRTEIPEAKIRHNVKTPSGKFMDVVVGKGKALVAIEVKADDGDAAGLAEQMRVYMDDTGIFCLALCGMEDIPTVMVQLKHLLSS